jgi:indoleamine 2,3-dioxygenase
MFQRKRIEASLNLEEYEVSTTRGFLPKDDPLLELPDYFEAWENAALHLPKVLISGHVRTWLASLPKLETNLLSGRASLDRAMLLLSYFGSSWVWGEEKVSNCIPANIAVPWTEVAERLGRPPILSYASHALNNWRRLDTARGIELGNIARLLNFMGGLDEEWFVLVHIAIEANAGPAITASVRLRAALVEDDDATAIESLQQIAATLRVLRSILERMTENCDPYIYYRRVRPFIFGWAANPALPNGVTYDGVAKWEGRGQKFRGETGAQSAIIPALDAALGVRFQRNEEFTEHLVQLRDYMPPKHRQLIEMLEEEDRKLRCRDWVARRSGADRMLADAYNEVIEEVYAFRKQHLIFAGAYIARQQPKSSSNPTGTGTGGTPFMVYLKDHAEQTLAHRV